MCDQGSMSAGGYWPPGGGVRRYGKAGPGRAWTWCSGASSLSWIKSLLAMLCSGPVFVWRPINGASLMVRSAISNGCNRSIMYTVTPAIRGGPIILALGIQNFEELFFSFRSCSCFELQLWFYLCFLALYVFTPVLKKERYTVNNVYNGVKIKRKQFLPCKYAPLF